MRNSNLKVKHGNFKVKLFKFILSFLLLSFLGISLLLIINLNKINSIIETSNKEEKKRSEIYNKIKNNYNDYVITTKDSNLYELVDNKHIVSGYVSKGVILVLDEMTNKNYLDIYYKIKGTNFYIKYTDVSITSDYAIDDDYKNYIPFNESVVISKDTLLYENDLTYSFNKELTLPIIIKEDNSYYVEYANKLLYVKKSDVKSIISQNNSNEKIAKKVAVLAYHYTYSKANGDKCLSDLICHEVSQVNEQFDYLNNNGYYATTMKDLELFLKKKINLPEKSVTITIDDGWWFDNMYAIANEKKINITLFFIGSLAEHASYILDYNNNSKYVELASHTYDMHDLNVCPEGQGSPVKCTDRNILLEDFKKSREQLKNTTYLGWPFYEYNEYSINIAKEAGFTMAFVGGMSKAYPGVNLYTVPRYTIHSDTTIEDFKKYVN